MSVWYRIRRWSLKAALSATGLLCVTLAASAADDEFLALTKRLEAEKPTFAKRQQDMLAERYDLADRTARGVVMSRGKPLQDGVRVKLLAGMTWEKLAAISPEEIKERQLWPAGFLPLPHPHHEAGGMVFPIFLIEETRKQTDRDLTRFDLDFDLPDHFLPEFPAPIYLTTRTDLGDVSQGKLVTLANYNELFRAILNPKQLEGLRLLVTPFPQQQFNATEDRRSSHGTLQRTHGGEGMKSLPTIPTLRSLADLAHVRPTVIIDTREQAPLPIVENVTALLRGARKGGSA